MHAVPVVGKGIDPGGKQADRLSAQQPVGFEGLPDLGSVAEPALRESFGFLAVFGDLPGACRDLVKLIPQVDGGEFDLRRPQRSADL
ncbi:MAG: hypothetical protein EBU23_14225 [Mycobacteriaceae bacterium]|nr:hypothetical protein [Mycobacteriaceae bacterium]